MSWEPSEELGRSTSSNAASASRLTRSSIARLPRVHIINSTYASHRRAAEGYRDLLKHLDCETHRLDEADIVIVHMEAATVQPLFARLPQLYDKYLVNICVWETNGMPAVYKQGLALMDEIWTPSSYCAGILRRSGFDSSWLPHVVEHEQPTELSSAAWAQADDWLGLDGRGGTKEMAGARAGAERFDVLSVTQQGDLRKNNEALSEAFGALVRRCPHARLIEKGGSWYGPHQRFTSWTSNQIKIEQPASDQSMLALMLRCQLVATSSHAEGWGMTVSQAMAQGIPVMAPAYSGSMTFLSRRNSLLVPITEAEIQGVNGWFRPPARWAHIERSALEDALVRAYEERHSEAQATRLGHARKDIAHFAPERVAQLLSANLRRIGERLRLGARPYTREQREERRRAVGNAD